ncbi:phytoene desaturase family protein [Staphylococcus sp. NRL 16/872]|uniref:phytoene desaturase family protein n=1 Tax=Staphylococcus sp. NRL 16/872 TaxID=2930131 RepID=UPI001FB2212F|nr:MULTISPECIES: phytoene desaturase family protein [unclassified Staphylococcus]MCJ1655524.1 phytoene desaturase family protein [Staphylococcus sp. NRL 21/187]MCJ1661357.1 phytoene desaturase family protein [Staphylococcus sp. NRL 18/288]MCJ1667248.1 phytoene desaturase family protein [Staphylococcus sp. NRL 19/737]WEN69733.1 phytoene desaturase family protein [Staphylococcus sp. NRL 16/872]
MKIAIVGAGVTGLAAAARLAAHGHQVTLFEKNEQVGGRMSQFKKDGFTFDMGPTIVMVPDVYKAVFEESGKHYEDYIDMRQLTHIFDIYFSDKDKVSVSTDLPQLSQALEAIEPGSTPGFMSFLTDVYKRYEVARKYFLERTFRKPSEFYNPLSLYRGLKLHTFNKANQLIDNYVANDKIRKLLAFQTLYIGIDPKQGPSIYSIIPMIEMMHGVYYIKGGMYSLAQGLLKLGQDLGVEVRLNSDVQEIIIDPKFKRADGLRVNDEIHRFDKVLCTADFPYAAQHLMPSHSPLKKYSSEKVENMDYSCSAFLVYAGINRNLRDKVHVHNVVFAEDFRGNIDDIFSGRMPEDPSLYLYFPAVEDETLAPEGQIGMYALMPVPELKTGNIDWHDPAIIERAKEVVYNKIQTIEALKDVREDVVSETVFTPLDFESRYNAKFGTAFGLMPTLAQSNYYRPPNVSRDYKDLYFAGASTHPGAGVPIVLTSAKITAEAMLDDITRGR